MHYASSVSSQGKDFSLFDVWNLRDNVQGQHEIRGSEIGKIVVNSHVIIVVDDYNNPVADLVDFVSFFFFSCLCSR